MPEPYRRDADRIGLIAESYRRLLGKELVDGDDSVAALWTAPAAIVGHGIERDPLFFFGNRTALALFEADVAQFTGLPSRKSAEAPLRAERDALMERVRATGIIDDYSGVRISLAGKRFLIARAAVWNLVDAAGAVHGQAAAFSEWTPLD